VSVVRPILHFARTQPDAPALIDADCTITYAELAVRVGAAARGLVQAGVRPADRVALCLKDHANHLVALLAVAHAGAIAVPLDWRARAAENGRFVESLQISMVLTEPGAALSWSCPAVEVEALCGGEPAFGPAPDANWHAPFIISASSGSTGQPKFSQMTHTQYFFAVSGMLELMDLSGAHRFLCTMPLYYSGGRNSCLAHLMRGDCVVLYPSLLDADGYVETIRRHNITIGGLVPSMVRLLLQTRPQAMLLPELHRLFSTGAPLHADEKRLAARLLNPNFAERYGTAETLVLSLLKPEDFVDRAGSVGQPHSLAEIEIVDAEDQPVPPGIAGRLRTRGPGLATPLPESAGAAQFRHGWYYPGEIAHVDARGYIFLHGRSSDVIIRNGAKIYPAEVEAVLLACPGVIDAAVFGIAQPGAEEVVVAAIVARAGVSGGQVLGHCRARLTAHKVPRVIRFVEVLPRNTGGKVDRAGLVGMFKEAVLF
jgi:acyl-coenzyme A synthetase/AMP-(fatty) acid ligase